MIINFDKRNNGGGGGTSDYSQLTNKPQINGVELVGNKTSQQLGITSESLEAVSTVPSGASVGDVYAINKSQTVGYGWEQIENGYAFNCSLNPLSGDSYNVYLGNFFLDSAYDTSIYMHQDGRVEVLSEYTNIGFTSRIEVSGGYYINVNYYNYHRIEFVFEGGVPTLQNEIASASTTIVENKAVQVETVNAPLAHWEFWNQYQGRYQEIQFWLKQNGQKDFLPSTELGLFHYYELYYKFYTNADGLFCIDYSNDSGTTWNQYIHNANIPLSEPEHYPIDITDPNGKNALFKAWFRAGNGNYGVTIKCNKFLWIDDYVTPTGALAKNLIKEGDSYESLSSLPKINGVELKGDKSTQDLGLTVNSIPVYGTAPMQKEINGTKLLNWNFNNDYKAYSIDWDGKSDMLLSFNWEDDWGGSGQTPYFSGGTWYGDAGWYQYANGKLGARFDRITSVAQGEITTAVTFYLDITPTIEGMNPTYNRGTVISLLADATNSSNWYTFVSGATRNVKLDNVSDGNLTINYGDNIEETIEILNGDYGDTTGWTWEDDHYYKYTPDLGKLMIFHYGSFYWEIRGGSGKLYINNPDVNNLASSVTAKEAYAPMVGVYVHNGCFWEKVAKKNESPAGGNSETWVPFIASAFTYVREEYNGDGRYGILNEDGTSYGIEISNGEIVWNQRSSMVDCGNGIMLNKEVWCYYWVADGYVYCKRINNVVGGFWEESIGTNPEGCMPV